MINEIANTTAKSFSEESYIRWQTVQVQCAENNIEFLQRKIEIYCSELTQLYSTLEEAVGGADYTIVCLSAHSLKNSCKQLSAETAYTIAEELEKMGKKQDLWCAHSLMSNLKKELQQLMNSMRYVHNDSPLVH